MVPEHEAARRDTVLFEVDRLPPGLRRREMPGLDAGVSAGLAPEPCRRLLAVHLAFAPRRTKSRPEDIEDELPARKQTGLQLRQQGGTLVRAQGAEVAVDAVGEVEALGGKGHQIAAFAVIDPHAGRRRAGPGVRQRVTVHVEAGDTPAATGQAFGVKARATTEVERRSGAFDAAKQPVDDRGAGLRAPAGGIGIGVELGKQKLSADVGVGPDRVFAVCVEVQAMLQKSAAASAYRHGPRCEAMRAR